MKLVPHNAFTATFHFVANNYHADNFRLIYDFTTVKRGTAIAIAIAVGRARHRLDAPLCSKQTDIDLRSSCVNVV